MQMSAKSLPLPSSFKYYMYISFSSSIFLTEATVGQKCLQLLFPSHVKATVVPVVWIDVDFHPEFCKALGEKYRKGRDTIS